MIRRRRLALSLTAVASLVSSCSTSSVRAPADIRNCVRHYDERMSTASGRLAVLKELTYFHPRNSKLYPPFLKQLLSDASPKLRLEALSRLDDHGIAVAASDLPRSVEVPLVGLLDRKSKDSIDYFKTQAARVGPTGGWAIKALGLMGIEESSDLAENLLESENIFVRPFCRGCSHTLRQSRSRKESSATDC